MRPGCRGGELNSFTNYLYRGEQYDSDLGLYYLRARYYNPATGRLLSRDPKEFAPLKWTGTPLRSTGNPPSDPKKLHKYLYASGDPVNRLDPTGRDDEIEYRWLVCGGSGECPALFPGLTATKVIGGGLIAATLSRFIGTAFGWLSEELEMALGPDLHDPGKGEPGEGAGEGTDSGGESSGSQ